MISSFCWTLPNHYFTWKLHFVYQDWNNPPTIAHKVHILHNKLCVHCTIRRVSIPEIQKFLCSSQTRAILSPRKRKFGCSGKEIVIENSRFSGQSNLARNVCLREKSYKEIDRKRKHRRDIEKIEQCGNLKGSSFWTISLGNLFLRVSKM